MPDQCARQHVVLRPLRFRFSPLTFRGFPLRGRTDGAIQRGALRRPFVRLPGSSMHLQTIVAITDFSAAAEQALDRAAMVAADHHARLRIHYGTDTPDPKFADPHARLEQRARQLARRHDVAVVAARQGTGDVVADALAATAGADLLVMDRRAHFSWGRLLRGSPWARVLRGSRCPVLIVQNAPKSAYRHVLVAVDFSETAGALVRYAGGLQGRRDWSFITRLTGATKPNCAAPKRRCRPFRPIAPKCASRHAKRCCRLPPLWTRGATVWPRCWEPETRPGSLPCNTKPQEPISLQSGTSAARHPLIG